MKKNITYLIIIIALLLPSAVAVKSYIDAQNAPTGAKNAVSITVDDINGNSTTLSKESGISEMEEAVSFFLGINSRAVKITTLPEAMSSQKSFRVTVSTAIKSESYQYYMSTTPSLCYLVDPNGGTYQITEADAGAFLESKYAESLYEGADRPTLTLSNYYSLTPSSMAWNYKNYEGGFTAADSSRIVTSEIVHIDVNGGLSVSFDIVPDICTVVVTDSSGAELFNDNYENLTDMRVDQEMEVSVKVSAKWFEDSNREYYGESEYSFTATLTPPASFYVMKSEVTPGEFISISAKRVTDTSLITFKSVPEIGTSPKFITEGDYAQALLAIPYETEAGEYVFTLTYGSTSQDVTLTVVANPRGPAYIDIATDVLSASYSDAAKSEFDDLVKQLTSEFTSERLFDGYFLSSPGGAILVRGYGREVIINSDTANSYVNMGVDYMNDFGSDVPAVNAGKVVYTGSTALTGNLVVVDHGMGLMTWYWNLGEISVETGAAVSRGDKIGTAGTTGLSNGVAGVHVGTTVNGTFVCPYDSWDDGDGGILMMGVYENNTNNADS